MVDDFFTLIFAGVGYCGQLKGVRLSILGGTISPHKFIVKYSEGR